MIRQQRCRRSVPAFGSLVQLEDRSVPAVAFALSGNSLLRFDTDNPSAVLAPLTLTGVASGETLVGLDVRPQNGQLYGLTADGQGGVRLYLVSSQNGVATPLTTSPVEFGDTTTPVDITGTKFGIDFNPVADRLRVVTDTGLNFRVDPNTGQLVDADTATAGIQADTALTVGGVATSADAVAYTNNSVNATATTLYALDAASNKLFLQNPPNGGTLINGITVTLNGQALDFTATGGFDIAADVTVTNSNDPVAVGTGVVALTVNSNTGLYSIDLTTSKATLIGNLGVGVTAIQGLALQAGSGDAPLVGLSADGTSLIRLGTSGDSTEKSVTISGVVSGETLVGIDYRPSTGQLLALGVDAAKNQATLYVVDSQTGNATITGTAGAVAFVNSAGAAIDLPEASVGYGFDVNPAVDLVRVVTGSGLNFRINPTTGAAVDADSVVNGINTDVSLTGGATGGTATAYTNSFAPDLTTKVTTQYTLDAATDKLFIQNPPNGGILTNGVSITVNGSAIDFTAVGGFDIASNVTVSTSNAAASGFGTAALTVGGTTGLYSIDLTTGKATLLRTLTAPLAGLAGGVAAAGSIEFSAPTLTIGENKGTATLTLTRTGGTAGAVTVNVAITGGTATAGVDFTAPQTTVTFAAGQSTTTVEIPITNDTVIEGSETIELAISTPSGGVVVGGQASAIVTIADDESGGNAPTISDIRNKTVPPGQGSSTLTFTVGDAETPAANLTVTAESSNATLLPAGSIVLGGSGANRTITVTPAAGQFGTATVTVTVTDAGGFTATDTFIVKAPPALGKRGLVGNSQFAAGGDVGSGKVQFYADDSANTVQFSVEPFPGFTGGIRTAVGDFNGDGVADLAVGTGPGRATQVVVYDGATQKVLFTADPFEASFTGGVFVAAGDIDGDGVDDVVITPDEGGGPRVQVRSGKNAFATIADFFGIDDANFRGGARAALGDVDGDGTADLVVSAGFGGGPRLAVFDGSTVRSGQTAVKLTNDFFVFEETLRNGAFVTVGDIDGDGMADIVAGGGPSGGPRVRALSAAALMTGNGKLTELANFFAGDVNSRGGIRVAVKNLDGDDRADIVVGAGAGAGSRVTAYLGKNIAASGTPTTEFDFEALPGFTNGVYVG